MGAFKFGGLLQQVAVTATAAGTTTFTNISKQIQAFTGTNVETIITPDATTMSVGQKFEIYNESTSPLTIQFHDTTAFTDAAGISYTTLAPNTSLAMLLQNNGTANGTWMVLATAGTASSNPSGAILAFGGTSAPTGYLMCDGSSVLRATWPTLFTAIGTAYGAADGTHFNLPDLRGRFIRGTSNGSGTDPDAGSRFAANPGGNTGDNVGSGQSDAFQGHAHTETGSTSGGGSTLIQITGGGGTNSPIPGSPTTDPIDSGHGSPRFGLETRPTNVYANYIIKT